MTREQVAIAWEQWISSDKGQKCTRAAKLFRSHNPERHLQNNMEAAFRAGFRAGFTVSQATRPKYDKDSPSS